MSSQDEQEYRPLMMRDLPFDERPRERLLQHGPGVLSDAELLAILLRTGVRGMNVVALSQHLLVHFGGLLGLSRADALDIQQSAKGLGPAKTAQLLAALEIGRRLARLTPEARAKIGSPEDAARLLMPDMMHLTQEVMRVVLLDTKNTVMAVKTLYKGSLNASVVRVAEVFRDAIRANAAAILIAHNHPSGDPTPSPEDVRVTQSIVEAGRLLDIKVLDHLVIGQNRWVSLRERGLGGFI
ncbi:DNA repair protein RadC [Ardenticatena maritima]|uniref:DNA repair protein RadC n=1 Tax=Ardenticatena maritima TaxID=872965 RepID=A0A0M8K9Q1_9CHLR|nr:DNA repair protein RadC [Ardenticatena maritima]KPL87733.1 DNA repair protein RadC [Ardenticatena maritima]GAP63156.1 DNA repair protein RadC [Ardenticatena maritima]